MVLTDIRFCQQEREREGNGWRIERGRDKESRKALEGLKRTFNLFPR